MFGRVFVDRGRLTRLLGWGIGALVGLVALSGVGSGTRAMVPPKLRVERVPEDPDRLRIRLEHSGRCVVEVRVELLEGPAARQVASHVVLGRRFPVFNPFSVCEDFEVELPPSRSAEAITRVTAIPGTEWTWQPPSRVRVLAVGGRTGARGPAYKGRGGAPARVDR